MTYFFIPPPVYVDKLILDNPHTLKEVCQIAGVQCRASGSWTERLIEIVIAKQLKIIAEAGAWGSIRMEIPESRYKNRFQIALKLLAYGLHDLVARQSIRGSKISVLKPPAGRPKLSSHKSNRQRQRDFRKKQSNTLS
jgi:hypothetical protein